MPDDVAGARLSLRLYSPRPHWFGAIAQRKMRVVAIYAAYLLVIVASVVGFESLPPQYEVSAMIDLQPMAYTAVDEQRFRTSKADEMARSQIALLTTESVIRGALADLSRPPALPIPVPLPQKAPKDIPVASSAYASTERLAARSGLEGARPARDPVRTANASTSMYEASALATGHATTSISKGIDGLRDLVTLAKETVWPPLAPADESYVAARKAIKSQAEPNTGLIRVSFTDRDPAYAVRFLDALIQRFTDKHYGLQYRRAAEVAVAGAQPGHLRLRRDARPAGAEGERSDVDRGSARADEAVQPLSANQFPGADWPSPASGSRTRRGRHLRPQAAGR